MNLNTACRLNKTSSSHIIIDWPQIVLDLPGRGLAKRPRVQVDKLLKRLLRVKQEQVCKLNAVDIETNLFKSSTWIVLKASEEYMQPFESFLSEANTSQNNYTYPRIDPATITAPPTLCSPKKKQKKNGNDEFIVSLHVCGCLWRLCCNEAVCIMHELAFERHAVPNIVIFCHRPLLSQPLLPPLLTVLPYSPRAVVLQLRPLCVFVLLCLTSRPLNCSAPRDIKIGGGAKDKWLSGNALHLSPLFLYHKKERRQTRSRSPSAVSLWSVLGFKICLQEHHFVFTHSVWSPSMFLYIS